MTDFHFPAWNMHFIHVETLCHSGGTATMRTRPAAAEARDLSPYDQLRSESCINFQREPCAVV